MSKQYIINKSAEYNIATRTWVAMLYSALLLGKEQ